ncbi:MAG: biopolymer transporter ExbD [Bdellovibrio sp.]|nr:biopolymer transporter ExbD [Bdellovibrio sp.]
MKKRSREPFVPDLTPMIDLIFLLLIFFLVSTVFKKEEWALLLNLPKAETGATKEANQKQLLVELSEEELALNGKRLDFTQMESELRLVSDKTTPVEVRIDKNVRYERIIKVFDLLKTQELFNLNLVTTKK